MHYLTKPGGEETETLYLVTNNCKYAKYAHTGTGRQMYAMVCYVFKQMFIV